MGKCSFDTLLPPDVELMGAHLSLPRYQATPRVTSFSNQTLLEYPSQGKEEEKSKNGHLHRTRAFALIFELLFIGLPFRSVI